MRVILLKDVGGVGKHDTALEVSDGYALNFLIPKGLAVQATAERVAHLEKKISERSAVSAAKLSQLSKEIQNAAGKRVVLKAKANAKGHLFKGIKREDVAKAIAKEHGETIGSDNVSGIPETIKEIGEYSVHLTGGGSEAAVTLVVEGVA